MRREEKSQAESIQDGGEDLLEMGVVGRAFGLRGQVRMRTYNPDGGTLLNAGRIFLKSEESGEPDDAQYRVYSLKGIRPHQGIFVADLDECRTRDDAEKLRGHKIYMRKRDLPELGDDEYYWFDMIGLEVWCNDRCLGRISGIQETAPALDGNDIFIVDSEDGEILVPAVSDVIREINMDSGRVILEPGRGYDPQV